MSEWQPIETAPNDGTVLIGYSEKDGVLPIMWSDGEYYPTGNKYMGWVDAHEFGWDDGGSWRFGASPSHWMPLPSPPIQTEGE